MKLNDLTKGDTAVLTEVKDVELENQLHNMGFSVGDEFSIQKKAAFNDPILISFGNTFLGIRVKEAKLLEVEKQTN